jgi:hypothetical protein
VGDLEGLLRIDGQRHPGIEGTKAARIEHLVRQQQVVAETGPGQALHLADGGAAEAAVAERRLAHCQCRALVRLHVGAQPRAGERRAHAAQVALEHVGVGDEGGCGEVGSAHGVLEERQLYRAVSRVSTARRKALS